jgi:hypothetical protein
LSINIDQIDPFSLPSVSLEGRLTLQNVCAIYFAITGTDEILYIGQALCLQERWKKHHRLTQLESFGKVRIAWLLMDS